LLCRGTVLLGYEQANRYQVFDQHGESFWLLLLIPPKQIELACTQEGLACFMRVA